MKTPYQILNVTAEASDTEIKQAYLQKVKDNPPDHDKHKFQSIHDAYTAVKDVKSRLSYELFAFPIANFDEVIDQALNIDHCTSLSFKQFNALLQESINDSTIQNAIPIIEKP
jgi:DnaJ-class molecular chaperone